MPADLTVILEHRPGELARLGEIAGEAGVTIHGLAAFTGEGRGVVHFMPGQRCGAGAAVGVRLLIDSHTGKPDAAAHPP